VEDFFTGQTVQVADQSKLTWTTYPDMVWERVYPQQVRFCTDEVSHPIHHCLAEMFDLRAHCREYQLIPVACDRKIPNSVAAATKELTKISNQLWTTKWGKDKQGPAVVPLKMSVSGLRDEILKAEILDARPKDEDNEKELTKAIDEELELLTQKASGGGADMFSTFKRFNEQMEEIENQMRDCEPDRLAHYMEFRDIEGDYVERLMEAVRAQSILEKGKLKIRELLEKYKSKTEILWWELRSKSKNASCPTLNGKTMEQSFEYQGLVPNDVAGIGTLYKPPPQISTVLKTINEKMVTEEESMQADVDDLNEEIPILEQELAQEQDRTKKREKRIQLNIKKRQLENAKACVKATRRATQQMQKTATLALDQVQKCDEYETNMKEALKKSEKDFAEMVNKTDSIKAVWQATSEKQGGSTFITQMTTKTISSQKTTEDTHVDTSENSVSGSVGGSFAGFGGKVSAGYKEGSEESKTEGHQEVQEDKFHFECEGDFGELNNALLEKVLEALESDQWCPEREKGPEGSEGQEGAPEGQEEAPEGQEEVPQGTEDGQQESQKGPGYLWKAPPGKNVRFYVKEVFFARKLVMFTSNTRAAGEIVSATTKSNHAVSGGVAAQAYGVEVAAQAGHGQGESDTHSESSMKKNSKDSTLSHGDLYIKFLLLAPITPGPKRSQNTKTEPIDTVEYAKQHLGV